MRYWLVIIVLSRFIMMNACKYLVYINVIFMSNKTHLLVFAYLMQKIFACTKIHTGRHLIDTSLFPAHPDTKLH